MQKEYIMTKREMEAYCGDTKQIFGIQECRLEGGKATGTKAFHVRNGKGIETLILADKCLGIGQLFFKGTNIGFLSKAGIVAPQFFSEEGTRGFLRTFEAGFLTTCGLSYMGQPSEVNGQKNGLHGVISNIPVESLSSDVVWSENGDAVMLLTGKASEGYLFGPNLEIRKTILIHTEQNRLEIHDRVDNKGFSESPLMLLYHINFGYPMLDENVQIYNNYDLLTAREDPASLQGIDKLSVFEKPVPGADEIVGYWRKDPSSSKEGKILVHNPVLGLAVEITVDTKQLPILNQWRSVAAGDYALGLEPGTSHVGGYTAAAKDGLLMMIGAGESRFFDIIVDFHDDPDVIKERIESFK